MRILELLTSYIFPGLHPTFSFVPLVALPAKVEVGMRMQMITLKSIVVVATLLS